MCNEADSVLHKGRLDQFCCWTAGSAQGKGVSELARVKYEEDRIKMVKEVGRSKS